jgi:hypothetical protein
MAIKKDFENCYGVKISYWRISQLSPIKPGEISLMGAPTEVERVLINLSGYLSEEARGAGKAVMETRAIMLDGSVDEGREELYKKIMLLPDWEGSEEV